MYLILVAAGGAVGSAARYLVGVWSVRVLGLAFPWGTLIVNIVGSFIIGLLSELIARRFNASIELRLLLVTGFLGGFTTFSAFSLDTIALCERGQVSTALAYVLASVALSFLATFGGMAAIRSVL